jgi:hypothetical protein
MSHYSTFVRAGILAVAVFFCTLAPDEPVAQDFGSLDGTWEGQMKFVDIQGNGKTGTYMLRLVIKDQGARVFNIKDGEASEIKGKYEVHRLLTNAVIFQINSGQDNEGRWVETWVFVVTQKDRNTLITHWLRVVNNNNLPLSVDHSKFSVAATGDLVRK